MKHVFDTAVLNEVKGRMTLLKPDSERQWGKMNPAQMLCHCSAALETGTGDRPMKQAFLGKVLVPFIRSSVFGPKPGMTPMGREAEFFPSVPSV